MESTPPVKSYDGERECFHLSAEELKIYLGEVPEHWYMMGSKETESKTKIAMLREVSWFEVKGELVCSPRPGAYTVSWRARLENFADGWDGDPVEFTFSKKSERKDTEGITRCRCYLMRPCRYKEGAEPEPQVIFPLENVWMEFDVGKFDVEEGEGDITLSSTMIQTSSSLKKGLTLGGLVIRPIKSYDFDGHPRTGHRFRSEKSRTPVQDEKSRSPVQDEKARTPLQDEKSGTSLHSEKTRTPVQDEKSRTPLQDEQSRTPVQDEKSRSPVQDEKSRTPLQDEQSRTPVQNEKSRSPIQDEKSRSSVQDKKSMFSVQYWTWVDFLKFHYVLTMLAIFIYIVTSDQCIWN